MKIHPVTSSHPIMVFLVIDKQAYYGSLHSRFLIHQKISKLTKLCTIFIVTGRDVIMWCVHSTGYGTLVVIFLSNDMCDMRQILCVILTKKTAAVQAPCCLDTWHECENSIILILWFFSAVNQFRGFTK